MSLYLLMGAALPLVSTARSVAGEAALSASPSIEAHAGEHEGHDHVEGSDLDRGVEELFAAQCEHRVPAHSCAECRYEVGVVKVPKELIAQKLVEVGQVGSHSFSSRISLTGEVRFDESKIAHLGPRLPGVVGQVMVGLGQEVRTGTPLLEIDSPALAEAQAAYLRFAAETRLAQAALDRKQALREAQISSEREYLEAEQTLAASVIQTNAERQKLLRLGLSEEEVSKLELAGIHGATGRYVLRAPFGGQVMELHAVRGERVEPGAQLLLFGDVTTLWVWVDVYEDDLAVVANAAGATRLAADIQVRAWPGQVFHGWLDFVGRTMDERTRTVKARVTVSNSGGRLRPGMFATIDLPIGASDHRLAVPATAVLADEGRKFVFVRHATDYFVRRPVRTGRRSDGMVEVEGGVEEGQTIAVAGAFLLKSDVLRSKMGAGCAD